jgi:hypothetical protein
VPRPHCRRHSQFGETQRERWIANTLAGWQGRLLRRRRTGRNVLRSSADRYAARDDALGVSSIDERLAQLAKDR